MERNDYLLDKNDPDDIRQYNTLTTKAFNTRRKIEKGFLDLKRSNLAIKKCDLLQKESVLWIRVYIMTKENLI